MTDLPDTVQVDQENPRLNEKERELLKKIEKFGGEVGEKMHIGIIDPFTMPNAYFNVLCYTIGYKTGTSLKHVMEMNLFDFISYIYIISETQPEEGDNQNPETRNFRDAVGG